MGRLGRALKQRGKKQEKSNAKQKSAVTKFVRSSKPRAPPTVAELTSHLDDDEIDSFLDSLFMSPDIVKDTSSEAVPEVFDYESVRIPRRPRWHCKTTAKQLERLEQKELTRWKRHLNKQCEASQLVMTPCEKNLEVWRQLWRVLERADIVFEIVDARNPMLFRSRDLEQYASDLGKRTILLVNKSDMLTEAMRQIWADFFCESAPELDIVFFSAMSEQVRMDMMPKAKREVVSKVVLQHIVSQNETAAPRLQDAFAEFSALSSAEMLVQHRTDVWTADQLLCFCDKLAIETAQEPQSVLVADDEEQHKTLLDSLVHKHSPDDAADNDRRLVVGFVGYPNVGKSSIINVLTGQHLVATSQMPGKTKHFQTLNISDRLQLCDCPGLVFPTFALSRADLVCHGVVPIERLDSEESLAAARLMHARISRQQLQHVFTPHMLSFLPKPDDELADPDKFTCRELLQAYGHFRGYLSAKAQPNESKAARELLKDLVTGKLLYCHPPPELNDETRMRFLSSLRFEVAPDQRDAYSGPQKDVMKTGQVFESNVAVKIAPQFKYTDWDK